MPKNRGKGPLRTLALLLAFFALVFLARNFWILGYFAASRDLPSRSARGSSGAPPPGGGEECPDCHDAIGDLHRRGPHRAVICEECHGTIGGHVRDGEKIGAMPESKNIARLCSRCHRELNARGVTAPKLNLEAHVVEAGALFSDRVCLDCHLAHDPRP